MSGLSRRRRLAGHGLAVLMPVALTAALVQAREPLNLVSDMLLFVLVAVIVALVGGLLPALVAAVAGSVLLNYFFTPPLHTLSIDDPNNALALGVFVLVAVLVSSTVDIAARRRARLDEAAATTASLEKANELRTALLAAVGHDLRSPLASAKAAISSLRSDALDLGDAERRELLGTADASIDRLDELVANLLDMSRLRVGAVSMQLQPTDVPDVVEQARRHLGADASRVAVDIAPDFPALRADPGLLERVLANLLANALRWSTGDVTVHGRSHGGWADIQVVDHGVGVPSDQYDRIFTAFQHVDDAEADAGLGLGVAVSRGLAEAMGGSLVPSPTSGGGLTMTISLDEADESAAPVPGQREREDGRP